MTPKNPKATLTLLLFLLLSLLIPLREAVLLAMPRVERIVLPNQLVLLVGEEHSLPLVTLRLLMDSGSRRDPGGKEGLANLTAKGLLLGTSTHSVTAFSEALDFMGASLNSRAGRDNTTLGLRVLKRDLDKGFDLFMEAVIQPTFPQEEIQRQVEKTLAAIQSEEDRPGRIAGKAFQRTLFSNNPYGHPVKGTKESLSHITREALLQFHKTYYHPNNAILAVVGDITIEEVRAKLIPRLSQWPMGKIPDEHFTATFTKGPKTVRMARNISQANIILGHKGMSRKNPDYYAATVMNYILGGGGFGSRLFEEIRVKRGLAYSVASSFDRGKYPGSFQISLQTKNASAQEAISLVRREMERIRREPVSEEELDKAKKYLIGSFPLRLDTQAKLARFITQVEYHDLGFDYCQKYPSYINAVTGEDVLRVAKSYLDPEKAILVVVANLEEAGMR
jgi:zinc protease